MSNPPLDPNGGCKHSPGSEDRVKTFERRYAEGWAIHHPQDMTHDRLRILDAEPGMNGRMMAAKCDLESREYRHPKWQWSNNRAGRTLYSEDD